MTATSPDVERKTVFAFATTVAAAFASDNQAFLFACFQKPFYQLQQGFVREERAMLLLILKRNFTGSAELRITE